MAGHFDECWPEQADADGITMRQAVQHAGLCIEDIRKLKREPLPRLRRAAHRAGPGRVRYLCEVVGMAATPGRRRWAVGATRPARWPSWPYLEKRAAAAGDSVSTIGMLQVPNGSINLVPGRRLFSLDTCAHP